jgi:hypothetical protein
MDSIGSFAESLILQDLEGINEGKKSSFAGGGLAHDPNCPDISEIELTDAQRRDIVNGGNIAPVLLEEKESPQPKTEPQRKIQEAPSDPITALVEQLSYLIEKAESLVGRLDEMTGTTVGAIGTVQKFNLMTSRKAEAPKLPRVSNLVKRAKSYRRK